MTNTARTLFDRQGQLCRRAMAVLAAVACSCLVSAWGNPSVNDAHHPEGRFSSVVLQSRGRLSGFNARSLIARRVVRQPSKNCGEAAWTILDEKHGTTIFAGKADCTKLQFNGYLSSIMTTDGGTLELQIQYQEASSITCANGTVSVNLVGFPEPAPGINGNYSAGQGNPPPPGSSCSLSVGALPNRTGIVSGGMDAVLGRCPVVGGCAKPSDYDLARVQGSFDAYYTGPPNTN